MSIFEKLTLRFQEKISGNNPKLILALLVKRAALEAQTDSACNLGILSKLNELLLNKDIIPDQETTDISLKSWPAIAELLISHGGRPSITGFQQLSHQAKEYKKQIGEQPYGLAEYGVDKTASMWPWRKTAISLIEQYGDGFEWHVKDNTSSSLIVWLKKLDIKFDQINSYYEFEKLNNTTPQVRSSANKSRPARL